MTAAVTLRNEINRFVEDAKEEMSSRHKRGLALFQPASQDVQQQNKEFTDKIYHFADTQLAIKDTCFRT